MIMIKSSKTAYDEKMKCLDYLRYVVDINNFKYVKAVEYPGKWNIDLEYAIKIEGFIVNCFDTDYVLRYFKSMIFHMSFLSYIEKQRVIFFQTGAFDNVYSLTLLTENRFNELEGRRIKNYDG